MYKILLIATFILLSTFSFAQFVGIGTSSPTEKLEVAGNVKASGNMQASAYTLLSPKKYYYSLSGSDFTAKMSTDYVEKETISPGGVFASGGATSMTAGVHFPHGATVTKMTVYYADNSATVNLQVSLRQNYSVSAMASISSSGTPGETSSSTVSISSAIIDNSFYAYTIDVDAVGGSWPGTNIILRKVIFEYTLAAL